MNEFNTTDKEQIEMLKQWWNDYGKIIAIAIVAGLVIAFGWRYWRHHNIERAREASTLYGRLGVADEQKQPKIAKKIAGDLMQNYQKTPYATMAALWWGKEAVEEKSYNVALKKTMWVLKHSHVKSFKQIARLRAARILLFQKKPQAALTLLNTVDDKTYLFLIDEAKGDIYTAMQKFDDAAKAYKTAQSNMKAVGVNNPLLNMKAAS